MAKVINIVTGQEETELPMDKQMGADLIRYLLDYPSYVRGGLTMGEYLVFHEVIKMIENNSGTNESEIDQTGAINENF